MKAIGRIPSDLPVITNLIDKKPTLWMGRPLLWLSNEKSIPVFIERFTIPDGDRKVFLFGARYDVSKVKRGGESPGHGNFIEYVVVEHVADGTPTVHRLLQQRSITYTDMNEEQDYLPAEGIANVAEFCVAGKPIWKKSEARWPTIQGTPMIFVGQVLLPENEVTRTLLTWDATVYLFWRSVDGISRFKILELEK